MSSQVVAVGNVTPKELKFMWEIKNFSTIEVSTGTAVNSPLFYTASSNNKTLQWRLQLYPNGYKDDSKDYIAIFLQNMNEFGIVSVISVSVMNDSYKDIFKISSDPIGSHTNVATFNALRGWGWSKFEKKVSIMDDKNRTLVNDTLVISCSIFSASSLLDGCDIDVDGAAASKYNDQLFETGNYSDVIFSIEEKEMHLHKNIVSSVSPVFEAMLKNDMKESKDNLVTITDIKYDIMKELFRYIYTRNVNSIDEIANDLLVAADKYAIMGLKMICELSLCSTLNDENALQLLHLAVVHNASYLKPKVTEFVANRLKTFVGKAEFKELIPECKDEILNELANKQ